MSKAWIIGGTSEGIELLKHDLPCVYTSATEYGAQLAREAGAADARAGRMDFSSMMEFISDEGVSIVLDATHPYALEVTKNARRACECMGVPYMRVLRGTALGPQECEFFDDAPAAARFLEGVDGDILLTTGSKELEAFATPKLLPRIYARVLPEPQVLEKCRALGLLPRQIIAMQGPFGMEMNEAMLKHTGASYLVTKDSGESGGAAEKLCACMRCGVRVLAIARQYDEGETPENAAMWAKERLLGNKPRFPLWLDMRGAKALVVGGGNVARRRIETLLRCGMNVRVVCPEHLGLEGVEHVQRRFEPGDTLGFKVVLAATNERLVNRAVALEAKANGAWVSVADSAAEGNFHFPAFFSGGRAASSVHTGEPALTKRLMARVRLLLEDEL